MGEQTAGAGEQTEQSHQKAEGVDPNDEVRFFSEVKHSGSW